jgi:hypothetical protein
MATVNLNLTVTPSDGVRGYWLVVHDQDVPIQNDSGSVKLESPGTYILVWHFIGQAGNTLGIVGKVNDDNVVQIKQSTIPDSQQAGAGMQRFSV